MKADFVYALVLAAACAAASSRAEAHAGGRELPPADRERAAVERTMRDAAPALQSRIASRLQERLGAVSPVAYDVLIQPRFAMYGQTPEIVTSWAFSTADGRQCRAATVSAFVRADGGGFRAFDRFSFSAKIAGARVLGQPIICRLGDQPADASDLWPKAGFPEPHWQMSAQAFPY